MWSNCCPLKITCDRSSFVFAFGNHIVWGAQSSDQTNNLKVYPSETISTHSVAQCNVSKYRQCRDCMWSNCCPLKIACDRSSFFFAFGNRKECMMREPPFNLDIAWKSRELPASSSLFLLKWGQGGQKPHRWRCLAFAGKNLSLTHI